MANAISFGVGCFHFGEGKQPPFDITGEEYLANVKTALESVTNVSNVVVTCDDSSSEETRHETEELPEIGDMAGVYPRLLGQRIQFEIFIPSRIQEEITRKLGFGRYPHTERFKVSIRYTYHLPVTFIELIRPSKLSSPSYAVVIVREFLRKQFEELKSNDIRFEVLGPSPFHADFLLRKGEEKPEVEAAKGSPLDLEVEDQWGTDYRVEIRPSRGYDSIWFTYDPRIAVTTENIKEGLFDELEDELGFYYQIVQFDSLEIHGWSEIEEIVDRLVNIERMKALPGFFNKLFVLPGLVNEALTTIAVFEKNVIFRQQDIKRKYTEIYRGREKGYLQPCVDERINESTTYPTKETVELIRFFEARRVETINLMVALISAILGGAIGSLITIALSGH